MSSTSGVSGDAVYVSADAAPAETAGSLPADRRELLARLDRVMVRDRHVLKRMASGPDTGDAWSDLLARFDRSSTRFEARASSVPPVQFDEHLPVSAHRDEIARLVSQHQVVVVCGETGSGKTTQLPKILLQMGRGVAGLIGHTQPRRIAARTVAARIAEELGGRLGDKVGYQVRFGAEISDNNLVKVMTDGILLSELTSDRYLNNYDTLIIDEAHERSLNIDFILGYLRTLLPRRPDLKVIITSATIDPRRFSEHFGDAPVIEVSGRGYPVEVRYRPPSEEDGADFNGPIGEALREALAHGPGDVLVFLPGEREIRDAARHIRQMGYTDLEVMPLYARMGLAQQARLFATGPRRRVVLATNVAETSVTVPGICFVIDTGLARISRYSYRNKVQGLQVEAVSQASAEQRKGRCGRVAPGVCIRLYSEEAFDARPAYTDAEILRTNLAAVILQMKALRLGSIERFPFIDAPDSRFVRDGYRLLGELGALDDKQRLTPLGRKLARLPLDPQLARMLLEAGPRGAVAEVLTIAAALSIADPRERPLEKRKAADQAHRAFVDPQSDFVTWLNLWHAYLEQRSDSSRSGLRAWCRENFLSEARLREWAEVRRQLKSLAAELKLRVSAEPADYEPLHRALLSGLLSHVGMRDDERGYKGTRGGRFHLFPGSGVKAPGPKWVLAAALVQTRRLFAHGVARVEPEWIEEAAGDLVSRRYHEPRWDSRRGRVVAREQVTFLGLVLVANRRVDFARVQPLEARAIFIHEALVRGRLPRKPAFVNANRRLLAEVKLLERKLRRGDLAVDEQWQCDFYERVLPDEIVDLKSLLHWLKAADADLKAALRMSRDEVLLDPEAGDDAYRFPAHLRYGGFELPVRYGFEPGDSADGLTLRVPLAVLNQLAPHHGDWLVPGLLGEKVLALLRALPKRWRRALVPLPDFARACVESLQPQDRALTAALTDALERMTGLRVPADAWRPEMLPPHLQMRYEVVDEDGHTLGSGRDIEALQREHEVSSADRFGAMVADGGVDARKSWDFDAIPDEASFEQTGITVHGFPALVDQGDGVGVRVLQVAEAARASHLEGLRRLIVLQGGRGVRSMPRKLARLNARALIYATCKDAPSGYCAFSALEQGPQAELEHDLLACALNQQLGDAWAIRDAHSFDTASARALALLGETLEGVYEAVAEALDLYLEYQQLRAKVDGPGRVDALRDTDAQLARLLHRRFVISYSAAELREFPRYVRGAMVRLQGLDRDARRDSARLAEVLGAEGPVYRLLADAGPAWRMRPALAELRWLVEELRLSMFAQSVRTRGPVSVKRIQRKLDELREAGTSPGVRG